MKSNACWGDFPILLVTRIIVKCLTAEFRPVAISLRHLTYAKPLIPMRTEPLPTLFQFEQHEVSPLALELFLYAL